MFESSPQSKCAVAYILRRPNEEQVNLVVVFQVTIQKPLRIFRCESEVTQICTPGDDTLLIVGTNVGSIALFDIKEYESSNYRLDEVDYSALTNKVM